MDAERLAQMPVSRVMMFYGMAGDWFEFKAAERRKKDKQQNAKDRKPRR